MRRRRLLASLGVAAGATLALPSAAAAHGLVGREDLPIPKWLFGWGATAVLVASFVGLAVLWPKPRLEGLTERRAFAPAKLLDPVCGLIGTAAFALLVYAGYAGTQTPPTNNLTPVFVFVLFWVGLAVASLLLGDIFKAFNPWRATARAVGWVAGKASPAGLPEPMAYPAWLGRWPATFFILGFAWIELVYAGRTDPSHLATLALVYAALQFVGMSLYGIETWNSYGDGFGVYFGLFARLSPLHWTRGEVLVRPVLSGLTKLDVVPGTVALLCTMIGTTSFDGFQGGRAWTSLAPRLTDSLRGLGLSQANALEGAFTMGLVGMVLVVSGLFWLGVWGMQRESRGRMTSQQLAWRFVHSLVPIAAAYIIAHYFSLLAYDGQRVAYLVSDPLGVGSDYFGTAVAVPTIDYGWISATGIWYVQVAALVCGHVAGLILAHDRALLTFKQSRTATRSQYWMLAVMIAFTSLGLWLLSSANS
ncbi:MAG: hypothetical protein QOE11_1575 [Solirubrobacteraceae bacterium]|jgi:hypothetical protein|nr:hypothetical protein [Solirubrobacteraceae bacterium]